MFLAFLRWDAIFVFAVKDAIRVRSRNTRCCFTLDVWISSLGRMKYFDKFCQSRTPEYRTRPPRWRQKSRNYSAGGGGGGCDAEEKNILSEPTVYLQGKCVRRKISYCASTWIDYRDCFRARADVVPGRTPDTARCSCPV